MAELRKDPLLERWVLIAEERAARPQEFVDRPVVKRSADCPFCAGNEGATPHEVSALRSAGDEPDGPNWRVRVVPNRYPAVTPRPDAGLLESKKQATVAEPFLGQDAAGVHEVIVECPSHIALAGELTDEQTSDVLAVYHARLRALRAEGDLAYVQIFRNVGEAAGASIEHLHSQLIGLKVVPTLIAEECRAAADYVRRLGSCPFCDMIAAETASAERIVAQSADVVLVCPFASRFPYEMALLPREHAKDFEASGAAQLQEAARLLRRGLAALERVCEVPAYNCVLHTAPFDSFSAPHYHWHWEILPRLVKAAGFEWGTGIHINPVSPERAAAELRGHFAAVE